jgi:hypothetical protein
VEKMDSPMGEFPPVQDRTSGDPNRYLAFAKATHSARGKIPQAIAHRGYKAAHPENTMGAFVGGTCFLVVNTKCLRRQSARRSWEPVSRVLIISSFT